MLFKWCRLFFRAVLLCVFLEGAVAAQEAVPSREELVFIDIEEMLNVNIVTASKVLEESFLAPGTVYVITEEEIHRNGWRFLQDALKSVPSVYLYDPHSWVWGGQRGLVSNFSQTLLMINGREINNLIASEGFISRQFATNNIKRIEVMASPGSALYGANAVAGVINIITKEVSPDYTGGKVSIEAGSFDSNGYNFVFGHSSDGFRIGASGSIYSSFEEDYSDFVGDTENYSLGWADNDLANQYITDYENPTESKTLNLQIDYKGLYAGLNHYYNLQSHGLEKLRWNYTDGEDHREMNLFYGGIDKKIDANRRIKVEFQRTESKMWGRYHAGRWPNVGLESSDNIDVHPFLNVSTSLGVFTHLSTIKKNFSSFAHFLDDPEVNKIVGADITSADIQKYFTHIYSNKNSRGSTRQKLEVQYDWEINDRSSLIAGYTYDFTDYVGLAVTDGATGLGATYEVPVDMSKGRDVFKSRKHGVFAQLKQELKEDSFWLTAGVRHDEQNHYGGSTNPRLGAVWQPALGSIVKLMYGEAFREPTVFELSDDQNPDADPAKLRSYELNYSQLIGRNARVFLAGYHNTVTNFLGSVGSIDGSDVGKMVAKEQRINGAEFRMDAKFDKWLSFVNGSFIIDAEKDYVDRGTGEEKTRDLLSISKERANVGVSYNFTNHWSLSALYAYTGAYDALSGNMNNDEPFEIHAADEVNVTLSVRDIKMDDLRLDGFLTVTNLTDNEIYHANIRRTGTHKFLQDGRAVYLRLAAKW